MAKTTPEIDIITDSWEDAILSLNGMLNSLSTEIITANATYANTGNTTISRNAQLWGTFGANTIVVSDRIRGGNINGQYTSLDVATNVAISNTTTAINLSVSNGTVLSSLEHNTIRLGNGSANTVANTNSIITQSSATVNTFISSTLIKVENATSSANMTSGAFTVGEFAANTTSINLGANVAITEALITVDAATTSASINPTTIFTGNSTVNTTITSTDLVVANTTQIGTINPSLVSLGSVSVNTSVTPTTIRVTDAASNSTLNSTSLSIGNSTVAVVIDSENVTGPLTFTDTQTFSSDISVTGNATISGNVNLGDNSADTVSVNGTLDASLIPVTGNTLSLGSTTRRWEAWANNVSVSGTLNTIKTATFANTVGVTGSATLSNTLNVTGITTLSNTLNVTGATTLSSNTSVGGTVTINNDYVILVSANGDIGATTGSPLLIYRFPKAIYDSAKFQVQVQNTSNTQISELVLAHDGTDAYVTTYGTVASPAAANGSVSPLGTFTATVNNANVELQFIQTNPNSSTKVVAHLIK